MGANSSNTSSTGKRMLGEIAKSTAVKKSKLLSSTIDQYANLPLGENRPTFAVFGNFSREIVLRV